MAVQNHIILAVLLTLTLLAKSLTSAPTLQHLLQHCPSDCTCDTANYAVSCSFNYDWKDHTQELKNYISLHVVTHLSVRNGLTNMSQLMDLPVERIQTLDLSHNKLHAISTECLTKLQSVREIDLSYNYIDTIGESAFHAVRDNLLTLNLSSNLLNVIPSSAFCDLTELLFLDLSYNHLQSLPIIAFVDLSNLETLDLSFNRLSFLSSHHLANLTGLQILYLHNNKFRTFHADIIQSLSSIPSIDLSFNPFECSCAIRSMIQMIQQASNIVRLDDTTCVSPEYLQGRLLQDVEVNKLNCSPPIIVNISPEQNILQQTDLYLSCDVIGYPNPAVLWFTPWGDIFSHHTSHHLIGDEAVNYGTENIYIRQNNFISTRITALKNGSLHISKCRGFFHGNFTCLALNPIGNVSATVVVNVYSAIPQIYIESLIYGGMSAGSALVVLLIIIITITIIRKACCPNFFKTDETVKIPEIIIVPASDDGFSCQSLKDDHDDDDSPPDTPLTCRNTDITSTDSFKIDTPISESPPQGWLSSNMIETIEEVRSKLKYGVERKLDHMRTHTKAIKDVGVKKMQTIKDNSEKKIETIRTNVKSIKDSGTVYMQSIKDTTGHAANKVRAGVVMSVETMKYTVQSMKELCGTGDIGQTVSMVSMETDIDSNQSIEVTRSVTYV